LGLRGEPGEEKAGKSENDGKSCPRLLLALSLLGPLECDIKYINNHHSADTIRRIRRIRRKERKKEKGYEVNTV